MSNTAHTNLGAAALVLNDHIEEDLARVKGERLGVVLIGGERIGYATAAHLARCCSNEVPPVVGDGCGPSLSHTIEGHFWPTDEELRFLDSMTVRDTQEFKVREWTAEDVEYKKMAWEAQQPKHRSPYTKPQGPPPKPARRPVVGPRPAAKLLANHLPTHLSDHGNRPPVAQSGC